MHSNAMNAAPSREHEKDITQLEDLPSQPSTAIKNHQFANARIHPFTDYRPSGKTLSNAVVDLTPMSFNLEFNAES